MIKFLIWIGIIIGLIVVYLIVYIGVAWVVAGCRREPNREDMVIAALILLVIIAVITGSIITFRYVGDPIPKTEISQEVQND